MFFLLRFLFLLTPGFAERKTGYAVSLGLARVWLRPPPLVGTPRVPTRTSEL